jgi:class 3 adenylate cyclase
MAVFGAPRPAADHARRALGCAVAMQQRQAALNQAAEHADLPTSQIGIGVNTGTVTAGTIGGIGRLDYWVGRSWRRARPWHRRARTTPSRSAGSSSRAARSS